MEQTPQHDFGNAVSVDAEAIGQPGQRHFRLLVRATQQTAALWMEKQQLAGVGTYLAETCERLETERGDKPTDVEPLPFPPDFDIEFRVGQLALGYLEAEDVFTIQAFNLELGDTENPTLRCYLSRGQCQVLARKIEGVVSAGRPICPLCQLPMEPEGHACPRTNGHHP
jgi:uncharacterized repeat protein (TIGR03847 family)